MATNTQVAIFNDKSVTALCNQIKMKQEFGLTFPSDYNPVNELQGAYLILKDTKDRNNKPVLESCSQSSVATALMKMVNSGLSMIKGQCYPVAYAGQLQCQTSVYGNVCNARRFGMKDINASPIYEGDVFEFHIQDGKKVIDKHEMTFESIDNAKIIGAYAVAVFADGSKKAEVMTMAQLKQAWKQGFGYKEDGNGTHQKFTDQMAEKTVKNRLLKHIIKTYGEPTTAMEYEREENEDHSQDFQKEIAYEVQENSNKTEFEVKDVEVEVIETEIPDFMVQEDAE